MKKFLKFLIGKFCNNKFHVIILLAFSYTFNISYSQNFSGLEGKSLTKIDDIGAGLVSLIGSRGLEGKIEKVTVIADGERTLRFKLEYNGFPTAYMHAVVLNSTKSAQKEVKEIGLDLTGKTSPLEFELNLKDNVNEGFKLESAYLQIRIAKSVSAVGGLIFLYAMDKSWQKEIKAENLVLQARLEPVGITADLKEGNKVLIIPVNKPVMMQKFKEPSTQAKSTSAATRVTSIPRTSVRIAGSEKVSSTTFSSLDGNWKNSDPNARGITRIIISENTTQIQTFGKCVPSDCDWGKTSLRRSGTNYSATYEDAVAVTDLILEVSNNQIKVTSNRRYKDNRAPLSSVAALVKENTPASGSAVEIKQASNLSTQYHLELSRIGLALDKSETAKGAQGPDNNPIPLFEDLTVTKDFEFPYEITNISMDVFPDKNPASGIFYYLPAAYHLRWTVDEGYEFRVLYGTSSPESSGDVRMSATLSPNISKKEIDLISRLLTSYVSRNTGMKYDKVRLIPIRENPSVSFPADLNSQYEITADKVAMTISSSLRDPFQVSWVTDNNTKDEMQVALLEKSGIQGIMSLQPQSENIPEIKIPVIITLADSRTIGRIDLENKKWRSTPWKNQTPYPLKLKYLHMLLVKDQGGKSTPFIYSWSINDIIVPASASIQFDASKIPSWLDDADMAQRIWIEYSVVDCDECDRAIINKITGGTYGSNTKKVSFETFQLFDSLDVQFIQIKVRSKQGDPKGEKIIEFDPIRIYKDNEVAESNQLYVPLEAELSYEYLITIVMKNGNSYKAEKWISSGDQEIYIGLNSVKNLIPGIPVKNNQ